MVQEGSAQSIAGVSDVADTLSKMLVNSVELPVSAIDAHADSVMRAVDGILPVVDTLTVSPEQMFGPASYIPAVGGVGDAVACAESLLADNLIFKIAVLLCFAGYCVTLYMYRQQTPALLSVFRSKLYVDNLLGERNYTFDTFLNAAVGLGILALSLSGIRVADILGGARMADVLSEWAVTLLAPVVWLLLGVIFAYQLVVLNASGAITYSQKFVSDLRYLRKVNFSVASVLLTPLFLMYAMSGQTGFSALSVIILVVILGVGVFHLERTYLLFVDEKISKLYWFLYLCTVEIFPVTLLLLSARKFFI